MSLLSSEIHTALAELLQKLAIADNQARTQAEEQLNNEWFVKQPDVLLMGLVEQIELSQEPSVRLELRIGELIFNLLIRFIHVQTRSFAAVLFRRMASKTKRATGEDQESKEQFLLLQPQQTMVIRQKLLECLQNEGLPPVRHKISDAVAEIARQYSDNGTTQEEGMAK